MEDKLKYRLVGAAVILALMAFFLPLILDSKKYKTEIVSQIPPMPEAQNQMVQANTEENQGTLVIELDKSLEANAQNASEAQEQKPSVTKPETSTEQTATKKTQDTVNTVEDAKEDPKSIAETTKEAVTVTKPKEQTTEAVKPKENDTAVVSAEPKPQQESKPTPSPPKPEVKAPDFKEAAYLVQIGTFSNKDNASKLVSDLRKQDYRAYQRVSEDFSRVFVGPYPDKSIAESRSAALAKIVGNSVKVIEFDPIKH